MKRSLLYTLFLSGTLLGTSGCSDWLDVNQNPNEALESTISSDLLLTSVQNDECYYRIYYTDVHFLAEHTTKSGDYSGSYPFLTGGVTPQSFDDYWTRPYSRIANLKNIENKAIESGDTGFEAISKTLQAYEFRRLVDMFGDVPFTEASSGDKYLAPKYDDAATIYNNLIDMLDQAITLCDQTMANNTYNKGSLPTADIYFGGDFNAWKRYAASLELSLLMRISNVTDVSSKIKTIQDKIMSINENATSNPGYYKGETTIGSTTYTKMNPLYYRYGYTYLDKEYSGHKSSVPTEEVVSLLRNTNNPLLRVFADARRYLENDANGRAYYDRFGLEDEYYIGVPFGQMSPAQTSYASKIGLGVVSKTCSLETGPAQDIIVMQGSLVGFYLAEAALRGLVAGGDAAAKKYYEDAVTALFNTYETALQSDASTWNSLSRPAGARPAITISAAEAAAEYLSQNNATVNWDLMTTTAQKMNAIQTQKWLSLYMVDPLEAWSEVRRTDLPVLHASNCAQYSNKMMARFLYPNTEKNLNPDNYRNDIDVFTSLIFWDKENPDLQKSTTFQ
ncbi:SusD/RagB family nutrient-binding outer membrane lipoprotein [Parabacteroides sp.]